MIGGLGTANAIVRLLDTSNAGGTVEGASVLVHLNGCDPALIEDPAGVSIRVPEEESQQVVSTLRCTGGSPNKLIVIRGTATGPNDWAFDATQFLYNGTATLVSMGQGQGQGPLPGQPC